MTPIEWTAVLAAYSLLEYWLGRTDKVKQGSTLELVLSSVKVLAAPLLGAAKKTDGDKK